MLTLTDLFCGAGGSSTGAVQVPGVQVRIAANHWDLAVRTHNANHPNTDHATADIHEADPHYFPRTDILWASPECTKWSQAGGTRAADLEPGLFEDPLSDEASQRSRMLMYDVPRFAEVHRYAAIIVENVIDVATRPKYRNAFQVWLGHMRNLGYDHQVVSLNSMHAQAHGLPAPQSRDRLYVVFWRRGNRRPDLEGMQRPRAWCPRCDQISGARQAFKPGRTVGRYRQQYVYLCGNPGCGQAVEPGWLPAASAIDWTIEGSRIGDRDKPLADKTRRRIAAGIARYWQPVHLEAAGHTYDAADPKHRAYGDPNGYYRAWPATETLKTLHNTTSKALAIPVEGRDGKTAQLLADPMRTQTTRLETAMVVPSGGTWNDEARPADDPHRTLATRDAYALVTSLRGTDDAHLRSSTHTVGDPLSTVTAAGNHHGLVVPYYGTSRAGRTTDVPVGTLTTRDRYALVMRNHTPRGNPAQMSTPVQQTLRTLGASIPHSLITPGELAAAESAVDDCLFRMLEPHEVAAGMAFPDEYLWDGNRRERVRLAGNAVTPPAARDLIAAVVEAVTGETIPAA